jgi:GrpB-like predicted nucleotidyltransferase (UPF0157 family)
VKDTRPPPLRRPGPRLRLVCHPRHRVTAAQAGRLIGRFRSSVGHQVIRVDHIGSTSARQHVDDYSVAKMPWISAALARAGDWAAATGWSP